MSTKIIYQDADVYGREQSNGNPYELYNEEAVKNALIVWLTSKASDFIRNPGAGGLLDRILFKNMHSKSIGLFLFSLKNALYAEFFPAIKVLNLNIERNYQYRTLKIIIYYTIITSNDIQNVEVFTKDIQSIPEQKEQSISYTGYNLKMFCLIRKVDTDLENELLIYHEDEAVWRWGKYKFISFTTSDEFYNDIIAICNN